MIVRASDLGASAAVQAWVRVAPAGPQPALSQPKGLFEAGSGESARITADIGAGVRGLTVEEHAARVLAFLRGDAQSTESKA